jgi:hypothetical protein
MGGNLLKTILFVLIGFILIIGLLILFIYLWCRNNDDSEKNTIKINIPQSSIINENKNITLRSENTIGIKTNRFNQFDQQSSISTNRKNFVNFNISSIRKKEIKKLDKKNEEDDNNENNNDKENIDDNNENNDNNNNNENRDNNDNNEINDNISINSKDISYIETNNDENNELENKIKEAMGKYIRKNNILDVIPNDNVKKV